MTLSGNTNPTIALAKMESISTPVAMDPMVLVLRSDPSQMLALDTLIAQQQDPNLPYSVNS